VYIILRPIFESIVLGLNGQILVPLNLDIILFLVSARFNVMSTHPTNVILSSFVQFLLTIAMFFSFLRAILKCLKQATSKG